MAIQFLVSAKTFLFVVFLLMTTYISCWFVLWLTELLVRIISMYSWLVYQLNNCTQPILIYLSEASILLGVVKTLLINSSANCFKCSFLMNASAIIIEQSQRTVEKVIRNYDTSQNWDNKITRPTTSN